MKTKTGELKIWHEDDSISTASLDDNDVKTLLRLMEEAEVRSYDGGRRTDDRNDIVTLYNKIVPILLNDRFIGKDPVVIREKVLFKTLLWGQKKYWYVCQFEDTPKYRQLRREAILKLMAMNLKFTIRKLKKPATEADADCSWGDLVEIVRGGTT